MPTSTSAGINAEFKFKRGKDPATLVRKLRKLADSMNGELEQAMNDSVWKVVASASRLVAVDTGRLRASIAAMVVTASDKVRGFMGSNVEYAAYQEAIQPYLAPALESERNWILARFEEAVDAAVSAAS